VLALKHLRLPAIISSALVLPFIILELVNRRTYHEGFPMPLYGVLWLLPMALTLISMRIVQQVRTGHRSTSTTAGLSLGIALLIVIAWVWIGIILDQMSCFLGVPLCD
jgi:hypothetical protein